MSSRSKQYDQHTPQLPPRPQDGDALPLVHLRPHAGRCRTGAMPPVGAGCEKRPHLRCRAGGDAHDTGGAAWRRVKWPERRDEIPLALQRHRSRERSMERARMETNRLLRDRAIPLLSPRAPLP